MLVYSMVLHVSLITILNSFLSPSADKKLPADTSPKPTIFLPSINEVNHQQAATYLCLLENFFPDVIKVSWKEKNSNRVLPSHQGNTTKTNDTYHMHEEAKELLLKSLDRLIDLHRCSDGEKNDYKKARDMMNKARHISISELFKMDIPTTRKIKFIIYSLFGIRAHTLFFTAIHKKLC